MFRFGGEGPELAVLDSTDLMCPGKIGKYLLSGCKGVGDVSREAKIGLDRLVVMIFLDSFNLRES